MDSEQEILQVNYSNESEKNIQLQDKDIIKNYSVDITTLENENENYSLNSLFMGNGNCKGWNEDNMEIVAYIYNTNNYEILQVEQSHLTNH